MVMHIVKDNVLRNTSKKGDTLFIHVYKINIRLKRLSLHYNVLSAAESQSIKLRGG